MTGETPTRSSSLRLIFTLILIIPLLLMSCGKRASFSDNRSIPPEGWSRHEKPLFMAEMNDTLEAYDIMLLLRTTHNYPFRNIFLFVTTTSPGGSSIKDTVEYQLASEMGEWYGSGLGDLKSITLPLRNNIIFPESGTWAFTVEQGMRREFLEGVTDIGIIIRKREK